MQMGASWPLPPYTRIWGLHMVPSHLGEVRKGPKWGPKWAVWRWLLACFWRSRSQIAIWDLDQEGWRHPDECLELSASGWGAIHGMPNPYPPGVYPDIRHIRGLHTPYLAPSAYPLHMAYTGIPCSHDTPYLTACRRSPNPIGQHPDEQVLIRGLNMASEGVAR